MKFGVREICDVVFKALDDGKMGTYEYVKGQPVLYIDSAKTSAMEGAATTVYAQGGRGNTRLIAWEGEKTLTFTVEDALLSPIGFAMLSGAGLFKAGTDKVAMVHCTKRVKASTSSTLVLPNECSSSGPVFVLEENEGGAFTKRIEGITIGTDKKTLTSSELKAGTFYFVDYYTEKTEAVTELQIDAAHFGGFFYVEASTLFRREHDGTDLPAEIIFPRVKIQSNFSFNMSSTGDPSTFSFVMDAFPGNTLFDRTQEVLCAIQVIDETSAETDNREMSTATETGSTHDINDSVKIDS